MMKKLLKLQDKKEKLVIGVLSGTSIDGLDIALVNVSGYGKNTSIKVLSFKTFEFDKGYKELVLNLSNPGNSSVKDVCQLNFLVGHVIADKINEFIQASGLKNADIDLIGSHGQTIYHMPEISTLFGYNFKSTLQIGDPSVIANKTGILTVGDFRNADVAVNGDGAPLVPYLDFILFQHQDITKILVNIGGISNLTYLPAGGEIEDVIAFDTGPGNMIIDHYMKILFNREYDESGMIAKSGKIVKSLFSELISKDDYFIKKPPKSTGRERYGKKIQELINLYTGSASYPDIIRTVTEYTVLTISESIKRYLPDYKNVKCILLSGGGAKNEFIIKGISSIFSDCEVNVMDNMGIDTDNKEAVLFAVLANETINFNSSNIRNVTGAFKNVILGKICPVE